MSYTIRPYSPTDREAIRHICCETGFSGNPIDPIFCDRDVFADFLTRYYTDWEPESAWVVEYNQEIVGYLLGCTRYRYHQLVQIGLLLTVITPKVLSRLIFGRYNRESHKFLKWCCFQGRKETPTAPKQAGHLHFNILPEHRNCMQGQRLIRSFIAWAKKRGNKRIFGQIQTKEGRRTARAFEKFGFHIMDQKEISKFQDHTDEKTYVTTVVNELK